MRIHIAHRNVYHYDPPAAGVIQVLRLTPRNHEGQYVVRWRIDVSADTRLAAHEDAFGNITHVFSADGPFGDLSIEVDGEVETQNTNGIVRGTVERFRPSLFLRDTALTQADAAIRDFAQSVRSAKGGDVLAELHALLDRLFEEMLHDTDEAEGATDAAEAFARKRGPSRDLSHIFIAAAHSLGIPARYVGGYYRSDDALGHRRRVTPGSKRPCPISAGLPSIPRTVPVRPMRMCGLPSAWIRSAPRRCAACAMGRASRRSRWLLKSVSRRAASPLCRGGCYIERTGETESMTYCGGILVREGLVMFADTRTNAGVDNISTFRKLHVFKDPKKRVMAIASAGNLSISQSVVSILTEGYDNPETGEHDTLMNSPTMFQAAQRVGHVIRTIHATEGKVLEGSDVNFDVSFLFGGQIMGERMRLFMVYSAGNFIECTTDTPYLQIGEHKYGKPVLDRAINYEMDIYDALKVGLVSIDSTLRSNLSVGLPIDLLVLRRDTCDPELIYRIEPGEPYFTDLRERWSAALRAAHIGIPRPPYLNKR